MKFKICWYLTIPVCKERWVRPRLFDALGLDSSIENPIVEIRRSYDRLISTMGLSILVRRYLYIESEPWLLAWPGHHKVWHWLCILSRSFLMMAFQCRHVSVKSPQLSCLVDILFRRTTKEMPKLHITGPLWGESADGFPSQRASITENVSVLL